MTTSDCNFVLGGATIVLLVLIVAIGYGVASEGDHENAVLMENEYCSMVELYKDSQGQQGWPDFKHKYEDLCY